MKVLPYINMNQSQVHIGPPILNPSPTSLPSLSLWLVPEHWLSCPASGIELALVLCFTYGNARVSTLFSQIIPPSPSPSESKNLFSVFPLLPLHHSRAALLLSGRGAQLRAGPTSPASYFPRLYTDAVGTQHFVLSYCLVLISCRALS